jgi:hypothetical protein
MEVVLQWIDDLDDLVHATAFILIRTRKLCLQLGLAAALILQLGSVWTIIAQHAFLLAGFAAACVAAWTLALAAYNLAGIRTNSRDPA